MNIEKLIDKNSRESTFETYFIQMVFHVGPTAKGVEVSWFGRVVGH